MRAASRTGTTAQRGTTEDEGAHTTDANNGAGKGAITPAPPMRLSASAIDSYRGCPKRFYFKYMVREPESGQASPALVLANAIHAALERFFGLPPEHRELEILHRALRAVWPQHRRAGAFDSREEEAACGHQALEMLSRFYENFDVSVTPLARETWLSKRLANGVQVYGKADRLDPAPTDPRSLQVVDYKTGRHMLEPDELSGESAAQVYAVAAETETDRETDAVRLLYLQQGAEVRWSLEREDIAGAEQSLIEITDEILTDSAFEAQPGTHCRWCPFRLICPEADRVEVTDLTWDEDGVPF